MHFFTKLFLGAIKVSCRLGKYTCDQNQTNRRYS